MVGCEARSSKTNITKQWTCTVSDKTALKVEFDAWYIDLPTQAGCIRPQAPPPAADPAACSDKIETRVAGDVKLGFPVKSVTTSTTGDGDKTEVSNSSQELTALEVAHFDPTVSEVPAGCAEALRGPRCPPDPRRGGPLVSPCFASPPPRP